MSELCHAAMSYASRGWAVLPLRPRGKEPSVKRGCHAASSEVAQVGAWWEAHAEHNVGIATGRASGGLVVIDVDVDEDACEDGMATLRAWERDHGELPETAVALTGRGGRHLYYHVGREVRCSANKELGIDIRGEGGYVMAPPSVHPNGRAYEWENYPEDYGIAEADDNVLALIDHVSGGGSGTRFELPETIGAGRRNDTLFRYAASLQGQGYDDAYIGMALEFVNGARCVPPLGKADIAKIVASVTRRYGKGANGGAGADADGGRVFRKVGRGGRATGALLHDVLGQALIDERSACMVDGAPAIWDGNRYVMGWTEIDRATVALQRDCRQAEQREVRHYLLLEAPRKEASPARLLAFANGVLDLEGGLVDYDPSMVLTNVVPHDYDAAAECAVADRFLDAVSAGSAEIRANLEEVIGLCIYRSSEFGECPVLIGSGANGKSTYIKALRYVLGNDNVSSLDIAMVGRHFQTGKLLGKLANLGDDISNERLNGDVLSVFKKVCTGEWIYTDVKNGDGFDFRPYATMVFSCNEMPALGDSSEGMLRRLFPIPFDARFSREDADFDPRIAQRLACEEAARYLIRVGVEGLRRVIAHNGLTPNGRSKTMVDEVRCDNDNVLQWVEDELIDPERFEGMAVSEAYELYKDWCASSNVHPFGRKNFSQRVRRHYGYTSVVSSRVTASGRRSVRVLKRV